MFISIPRHQVQSSPPMSAQINWSHPLSKGLTSCCLLNEGGGLAIKDIAQNYISTATAFTWPATSLNSNLGTQAAFDGSTSTVFLKSPDLVIPSNSPGLTFSCWVNSSGNIATDSQRFMVLATGGLGSQFSLLMGRTANKMSAFARTSSSGLIQIDSSITISTNTWYHVCATMTTGAFNLYINGNNVGTNATSDLTGTIGSIVSTWNITLGSISGTAVLTGKMAVALIHTRALTPSEVQQLYSSPYCFLQPPRLYSVDVPAGGASTLIYHAMIG
jgi:hypothetical protein